MNYETAIDELITYYIAGELTEAEVVLYALELALTKPENQEFLDRLIHQTNATIDTNDNKKLE